MADDVIPVADDWRLVADERRSGTLSVGIRLCPCSIADRKVHGLMGHSRNLLKGRCGESQTSFFPVLRSSLELSETQSL